MSVQNLVCSVELALKLRELGVEQKAVFWWLNENSPAPNVHFNPYGMVTVGTAAFTVQELMQKLMDENIERIGVRNSGGVHVEAFDDERTYMEWGDALPDMLAQVLIRKLSGEPTP